MDKILIFLGMAVVTYFTRYTMIALFAHGLSPRLMRWLKYIPPAVLAALVTPGALAPQGKLDLGIPLVAVAAGAMVAWRTKNVFLTILGGLAVFWIAKFAGF